MHACPLSQPGPPFLYANHDRGDEHDPARQLVHVHLKDAYFNVPIAAHHHLFLRFAFQGRHYQFRVLPFGLSLSLRVFIRCFAAAIAPVHAEGVRLLPYLDDWLVCAPFRAQVAQDTSRLLHVSRLGLKVNWAKSCFVPAQQAAYLGLVLDSMAMRAERRIYDILHLLPLFRKGRRLTFGWFLQLLGKLMAASTVIPMGLLALHPLHMWLNGFALDPKRHKARRVMVSLGCIRTLMSWRDRTFLRGTLLWT